MLELLAGPLLVSVRNALAVDLGHVGEAVDDERAQEHRVRHFVALDREAGQRLQRLQLRDLDEAVDVVVLEKQPLQVGEAFELRDVRRADDAIEADELETDLHDGLLEVDVGQNLQSVAVDEKQLVALDLGVTGLDQALSARLLLPLVAVQAQTDDALHLVLPLLLDNVQQAFRANIVTIGWDL